MSKHLCDQLKNHPISDSKDTGICICQDTSSYWFFRYESYADAEDIRMGEADCEGDVVLSIETIIYFCPYCGIKLK